MPRSRMQPVEALERIILDPDSNVEPVGDQGDEENWFPDENCASADGGGPASSVDASHVTTTSAVDAGAPAADLAEPMD